MTNGTVDVLVVGGGPAGVFAALRSGDLGARTTLLTREELGGMAAHDGPVPVRTLAHAARLIRDAGQLGRYGISVSRPALEYSRLLERVREVVADVRRNAALEQQLVAARVEVIERAGAVRFLDPHTVETGSGRRIRAEKIILCTGGRSRTLPLPGFELTVTHSDAWGLTAVPPSMLVIGAGATGAQVASIFNAFGARVDLFQSGRRILPTEDEDVSAAMAAAFRHSGIRVHEAFGEIDAFEKTPGGIRMLFTRDGVQKSAEAALAVVAVGWTADTLRLNLGAAGVTTNARGYVQVDAQLTTSVPHIFAAGDVTGRMMLVPQALQDGYVAATNAVKGPTLASEAGLAPVGSFTDPEYAQAGLTEARAREGHPVLVTVVPLDTTTRTLIDGRAEGFLKLIVDRSSRAILGCHVVGERAVDIVQTAAIAIAAGMRVDQLARVPLSFPTYTGILGRAAAISARQLSQPEAAWSRAELL